MKRLLVLALTLAAVALAGSPATAAAQPALTLTKDCSNYPLLQLQGVTVSLTGFPPNTPFTGTLEGPDGGITGPISLSTDANGNFNTGVYATTAGTWRATIVWSGGTLVKSVFVDCAEPFVRRMVGKGSLSGSGTTASYAYIVSCSSAANANAPFEVRFGTQRFRLASTSSVSCSDDPAVTTPAAGFDTQTGSGTGTLTTGGPATIQWKFVDGGVGGASDRAQITIKNAANTVIFQGSAAPPGKFPGSTQTTGYNTAQLLP